MADSNLPEGTANDDAVSNVDPVKALEDFIDLEPEASDLDEHGAEPDTSEAGQDDEDEQLELEADAPQDEPKDQGRFVSNDANVKLSDGTVISVEALKRGYMSQQSFTRSTQENAERRRALDTEKAGIAETAQALQRQRDFLLQVAGQLLPQEPQYDPNDPLSYQPAKIAYDQQMRMVNQILYQSQTERSRLEAEEAQSLSDLKAAEAQKLWEKVPEFRDQKVYDQFWSDASKIMVEEYDFTPQELTETVDHRTYKVMRDLVKYQKALQRAKTVGKDLQQKPRLMQAGRRMDPKAKISREAKGRAENLRKTGDFDAGVAALMDHV